MRMRPFLLIGLGFSLFLAVIIAPFASEQPDGLERVAEDHKFDDHAAEVWQSAPLPDYAAPISALQNTPALQTGAAGAIGTLATFILLIGAGKLLRARPAP